MHLNLRLSKQVLPNVVCLNIRSLGHDHELMYGDEASVAVQQAVS